MLNRIIIQLTHHRPATVLIQSPNGHPLIKLLCFFSLCASHPLHTLQAHPSSISLRCPGPASFLVGQPVRQLALLLYIKQSHLLIFLKTLFSFLDIRHAQFFFSLALLKKREQKTDGWWRESFHLSSSVWAQQSQGLLVDYRRQGELLLLSIWDYDTFACDWLDMQFCTGICLFIYWALGVFAYLGLFVLCAYSTLIYEYSLCLFRFKPPNIVTSW